MSSSRRRGVTRTGDERGLDRVIAFGDAVVAIAITLIVLPLVDHAMEASSASEFLAEDGAAIGSAAITFAVIAVYWRAHHWLFVDATGYTTTVLWLEALWLASIVVLPIATVLDVQAGDGDRLALAIYLGTLLVGRLALRFQALALRRGGFLTDPGPASVLERWAGLGLTVLALVLAMIFPRGGSLWLLVMLLERPLLRIVVR